MQLGMVGLGRMGDGMRARLRAAGHDVVGYDRRAEISDVTGLDELVDRLAPPRTVWLMVPAAVTGQVVDELATRLAAGDLVIDGGNSPYLADGPRAQRLARHGIGYLDVGVSGGVWGREHGYALMVGGDEELVRRCAPLFEALKPPGEFGLVHAGGVGAGHYAKMVHNGIEYGLMQAYAEGYELLRRSPVVTDPNGVLKSWRSGTVVRSWLLDLLDRALSADPDLASFGGGVADTGEGRWAVEEAVRLAVPVDVIAAALFARFASTRPDSPATRVVSALRGQFGGHTAGPAG
ncbi:MAG TPA: decarboxylating 6-phosphogluconate dehydrogenase [Natronosporangium sp.]|nr:decarboxylating 6-phosphogluconate dehydrogenase [Natronosporangium sp.]